ncbi:InlB B-repeat-containing protein [Anaerostipes sp.]|uniref:InlB B-repeat-containing protein n=1 Tax=Anaerostipes sp. TaxID=1872530 RepID=UPI0025BA4FE3|nr:InlB B-repeat-containing protein [Anaerostipes sp.]MBS7007970.1 InlB B-repeat-containing protein [Anaerostipes sp.]
MQNKKIWSIIFAFFLIVTIITSQGILYAEDTAEESTEQGTQELAEETTAAEDEWQDEETENAELSAAEDAEGSTAADISGEKQDNKGEPSHSLILQKTDPKRNKTAADAVPKTEDGQTALNVSKGSIQIKSSGAAGGGLSQAETKLNPKGYQITGTTTENKIVVDPGVTTNLTFDNVSITNQNRSENCVTVSHANVCITLIGNNALSCGKSEYGALIKDGMDESALILQCEHSGESGHKCSAGTCGSLDVEGTDYHVTAIGNMLLNRDVQDETGFSNLTIKGGIITAKGGEHNSGIGAGCNSYAVKKGYTKNIRISGGVVNAIGGKNCAGLGSGSWTPVDGIYITGGIVYASGGLDSPGIGSGGSGSNSPAYNGKAKVDISNVVISGGDTVVKAVGDEDSDMPGIGCGKPPAGDPNGKASNVTASPDTGYQGYIQDGTSENNYNFSDDTPFSSKTSISVEKYYTKIYFGPYRDENTIANDTKEQIGANHVISKSGGSGFTESQLKNLTKVNGKQENGIDFPAEKLAVKDKKQIDKINEAKALGKIGDYPLTFTTPSGTEVTITVSLRNSGTDASKFDPQNPTPTIGANDFEKETGGDPFTDDELKQYGEVKGKDKNGNTIPLNDFTVDSKQALKINEAKTSGKGGVFDLTYTTGDGSTVKVKVSLIGYDEATEDPENGETIKGMNVISKTGGEQFTNEQLKELAKVNAVDENGDEIPKNDLLFSNPDQVAAINEAKTAGETGDFSLSFQTSKGTKVTVTVYLRDDGTDGAKTDSEHPEASIAANDAAHKTGGNAFTEEELIVLCKAKGKDETKNNAVISVNREEMDKLNAAKQAGKTGTFYLTFSVAGGKEARVKVTLTGEHKVSFNPNGGDYTPKTQTVVSGKNAVEPKEPKRERYTFDGWYYKGESAKEEKWNFETPVHTDMELKAKWTKDTGSNISSENAGGNKSGKKNGGYYWKSEDITKNNGNSGRSGSAAKTGDTKNSALVYFMMASGAGILYLLYRRNRSQKS